MTLEQAQLLDDILRKFPADDITTVIKATNPNEFYTVYAYLEILQSEGYIKILGGMGNERAIMLLAAGRAFILSGGYTAIIKKKLKEEEEKQAIMAYLQTANKIANQQITQKSQNKKWLWVILIIISAIYFYFTKDSNKDLWDSINTYISIIGGTAGLIGFIKS